jgi:hypothetical protein
MEVPDHGAEPFICLTTECLPEVGKCCDVIPLVGDLTFIDTGHELQSHNGVLGRISIEFRKFNDLRLHGDIGVGLNLPCRICSIIVPLDWWLNVLKVLLVENQIWVDIGHDVCLKRSS